MAMPWTAPRIALSLTGALRYVYTRSTGGSSGPASCPSSSAGRFIARDAGSFQQCMRDGVPSFLALALQPGAVVLAVWAGSEVGRRVRSTWMGLTGGMIVLFALSAAVVWLGLAAGLQ